MKGWSPWCRYFTSFCAVLNASLVSQKKALDENTGENCWSLDPHAEGGRLWSCIAPRYEARAGVIEQHV